LSRKSFVQAAYGFGALSQSLKAFSVKTRYAYNYDARQVVRETKTEARASRVSHKAGVGAGIDGLGYGIPVTFDALYMMPVAGKNDFQTPNVEMTLSAYVQI
jgi:hypothetical protein